MNLLLLVFLVFLGGSAPFPTTSGGTNMDLLDPDSYDYEELARTVPPKKPMPVGDGGPSQRCDYSPCLENQPPCSKMAAATGCLCPGLTAYDVTPEAPELRSVSWNGSEVVVRWCAPRSRVTSYAVTVGGGRRLLFGEEQRSGGVGDIEEISQVCVVAVNDAGNSEGSCAMYHPEDRGGVALKAGLIGGGLGLLLLLLAVGLTLLWRRKRQRKQEANITMQAGTAGAAAQ